MTLNLLQWGGCFLGLMGALMQASNTRLSPWGFVVFLLSNVLWLMFGYLASVDGLSVMNIGFTIISLFGIYRWRNRFFGRA